MFLYGNVSYMPNRFVPFLLWCVASAGMRQHTGISRRAIVRSRTLFSNTSVHRSGVVGSPVIRPIITANLYL